ncbi:proton channel OTOP3-like [Erpetoichthys calabaricus]|uniref:proton channel OTOP3-like n=1 Tax=Erpetoichthys calabaricus TaxID=27687 RepID=UPI002233FC51|nr:proton channel OTOP3-like [Erpetoichthys calabaricus]XP_051774926.1 proton channel OTOP3-like [Erpetoichthys calabaricus]
MAEDPVTVPTSISPQKSSEPDHADAALPHLDIWSPSRGRMFSGLLALNVIILGAALVVSAALKPQGLRHHEDLVFLLFLMALSMVWMTGHMIRERCSQGAGPHTDHHAGSMWMKGSLFIFGAFSLLLQAFRIGYYSVRLDCEPLIALLLSVMQIPFIALQVYFLGTSAKNCIHFRKNFTRFGLLLTLLTNMLLWLSGVTDDTIHMQIEADGEPGANSTRFQPWQTASGFNNTSLCHCSQDVVCSVFQRGCELLYPFNIEYHLTSACMLYVMWKNVGRRPHHQNPPPSPLEKLQLGARRLMLGSALGTMCLIAGLCIFILYQVQVGMQKGRHQAFLLFYSYHLVVLPVMLCCSLVGTIIHRLEDTEVDSSHNPSRRLDISLLIGSSLGHLAISYFSLVAALGVVFHQLSNWLDFTYSLLSLFQVVCQNIFIIEGLHRPTVGKDFISEEEQCSRNESQQPKEDNSKELEEVVQSRRSSSVTERSDFTTEESSANASPTGSSTWRRQAVKEIAIFLILTNIMLWVIPAFGAHPQLEEGLGKAFFGFRIWFVILNLGLPLGVFYRIHSVGGLLEVLFIS